MSVCDKCGSTRLLEITSKVSDAFNVQSTVADYYGYVPGDLGIGGGDYVEFDYCLDCGKIQGDFPLPQTEIESNETE